MPPIKLLTIGDSISQGFMSMSAARTDLSYSTIVAKCMAWINEGYHYPYWEKGGHPLNLELVFRKLSKKIGNKWDDWNPLETAQALDSLFDFMDEVENYYERGLGRYEADYMHEGQNGPDFFHNIAVRGFNISDAWSVSHDLSKRIISKDQDSMQDNKRSLPSASFFRTAARVMNPLPVSKPEFNYFTAIDWLQYHSENRGIENLFLWLGANNVLATILQMRITQTPGNLSLIPKISTDPQDKMRDAMYALYENRYDKYNLWHVKDFIRDYDALMSYVDEALNKQKNNKTNVFIATVPYVTILPLARGMGSEFQIDVRGSKRRYFEYYTYFPFDDERLADVPKLPVLKLSEVLFIEEAITTYNVEIKRLVDSYNAKKSAATYHLVDIATAFEQMAFRRNNGVPQYQFPEYINNRYPKPDTRYYERHPTQGAKGGLFSLDGVHPTAIGQALIAHEFLKTMKAAGINPVHPIKWEEIYKTDLLYSKPITLVADLFKHDRMKKFVLEFSGYFRG